jgi:hypothetical protein
VFGDFHEGLGLVFSVGFLVLRVGFFGRSVSGRAAC